MPLLLIDFGLAYKITEKEIDEDWKQFEDATNKLEGGTAGFLSPNMMARKSKFYC